MTATTPLLIQTAPPLDIGRVISETLRGLRMTPGPLALLALVFVLIPQVLAGFAPPDMKSIGNLANLPGLIFDGGGALIVYRALTGGAPMSFGEAAGAGAGRFGSLFGMGLIAGIATLIGLVLLVVPGLFLVIAWAPMTAALMVENLKATDALKRAWTLTDGVRWRVAALVGIMAAILIGLVVIITLVGIVTLVVGGPVAAHKGAVFSDFVVEPVLVTLFSILSIAGATALYVELRRLKEGGVDTEVAQVFS